MELLFECGVGTYDEEKTKQQLKKLYIEEKITRLFVLFVSRV